MKIYDLSVKTAKYTPSPRPAYYQPQSLIHESYLLQGAASWPADAPLALRLLKDSGRNLAIATPRPRRKNPAPAGPSKRGLYAED